LVRNPNYWNAPRPYVDKLIFKPIVNEEQRTNSFKAGEAQLEFVATTPTAADLSKSYTVLSAPSINIGIEMFNVAGPPFNDVRVRKAIQLVIDRDQINKVVYQGVLDTPNSYFPSNYPYSDPSLKLPNVDVAAAQKLIDDYVASTGKDVEFTWTSGNATAQAQQSQLAQQMVQQLKHVKMNLKIQSSVQSTQDIKDKNFDAISTVITGPDPEPQFFGTVRTRGRPGRPVHRVQRLQGRQGRRRLPGRDRPQRQEPGDQGHAGGAPRRPCLHRRLPQPVLLRRPAQRP
jgi:peptide/nickel transport system substrate-binding protein